MPELTVTPIIQETIEKVLSGCTVSKNDRKALMMAKNSEGVNIAVLQSLLVYSKQLTDTPQHLFILLKGSVPYHYIPPPKPRDPELEKRVQRLRAEMENRQYRKMVKNIIEPKGVGRIKDSMELRDATSQMSVGLNIIVTMFSCFVVGWYLGAKYFGDDVLGVCTGIICLIIGLLVDMWLFVINASTLDKHIEKQKRKHERQSKLLPNYQGLVKYD